MRHDMSKEKMRSEFELPEGWREFVISDCKEDMSKAGNVMFVFTLIDKETEQSGDIYAIATPQKRWFLKQMLTACGIAAGADGVYDWEIVDTLNKPIMGKIVNAPETFINRNGEEITKTKSRVTEIRAK